MHALNNGKIQYAKRAWGEHCRRQGSSFFTGYTEIFSGVHIHVVYAVPLFSPQAYAATYSNSIQSLRSSPLPIGKYLEINFIGVEWTFIHIIPCHCTGRPFFMVHAYGIASVLTSWLPQHKVCCWP